MTTRTLDPLDRVTAVSYPDSSLNVTYSYDAPGAFAKGRLTGITRHGETIGYSYDRFGRLIQDGVLGYGYDGRDNRTSITYPDGAVATYSFDSSNREQSLAVLVGPVGSAPVQPVANGATYLPFGPLASVTLGNGLAETRIYDLRYSPASLQVGGSSLLLSWSFATDPVGNITSIADQLNAANNRSFGYLDISYFPTQGNGPWGPRAWTYDKIGNRLTESRGNATDTYNYVTSSSATTAKLAAIALASGGFRSYSYDAAGNTLETVDPTQQLDFLYDAAGSLSSIQSLPDRSSTDLSYDGRRFLRRAQADSAACSPVLTVPTYSSDGLLLERTHRNLLTPASPALDDDAILYFAGRPIADLRLTPTSTTLTYLSTDHLGTPILATTATGTLQWQGGFEPFGADWNRAQAAGEFLRLPGQWLDTLWGQPETSQLLYNVRRWYTSAIGRYLQADPLDSADDIYTYVLGNPIVFVDPLGQSGSHPGGPFHPPSGVKTSCDWDDPCPVITARMWLLSRMLSSHEGWDRSVPRPRGGGRHWQEIGDLWRQLAKCQTIYLAKCAAPKKCEEIKQTVSDLLQWLADHPPTPFPSPPAPIPLVPLELFP